MTANVTSQDDITIYKVVMNHEAQYSILLDNKETPPG